MHNKNVPSKDDVAPATKRDIRKLERDIKSIRNDLSSSAKKDDLTRFATKDDLARFATKDDLARFVTKDDLARFPTKDEMTRAIAVASTRLELKMDALAERVETNNETLRSQVTTWVTTFLAKLEGVSNGETTLVHRVEGLEGRVSRLEALQTP